MVDGFALRQLQAILRSHRSPRVLLLEPQSLSWLLGARWNIRHSMHDPVFSAVVHADSDLIEVLAATNESTRLWECEFESNPRIRMRTCGWWEDRLDMVRDDEALACDQSGQQWTDLSSPIRLARRVLSSDHQLALRALTDAVADIVEGVATGLRPSKTGFEVSGELHAHLLAAGIDPLLVLVGSGSRLLTDKHPLPTAAPLGQLVMLSVGARRAGVVTSVTRYVHFGHIPEETADRYSRLLNVEAAFLDASRSGVSLDAIFERGKEAYGRVGLDPTVWQQHHQGGLAGFSPREIVAGKGEDLILKAGNVVAWNPSAQDLKVEDVAIVGDDGCEALFTHRGRWPTTKVRGRTRPHILQL